MNTPTRVGIVGAGKISAQYSATFAGLDLLEVTAVADLDDARAQALADRHPGATVRPSAAVVAADDVDVVLNLTPPAAHAQVTLAALAAGKHVYSEKPLAATTVEARVVVAAVQAAAATTGLRVACAPDTVLGTGVQTARAVLESGTVGVPHAATAFMTTPGHERWHPDPEFYYRPGGGPLLDMGPYYLTTLVHLLGPVARVVGLTSRPAARRTIGSGPRRGQRFDVEVDTHVTGVLQHAGGALSTLMMSFDTWAARLPRIEVYGSAGTLSVPDPNHFDGEVSVFVGATVAAGQPSVGAPLGEAGPAWRVMPPSAGHVGGGRGVGVADLARAVVAGEPHRCALDVALHVLDVMECLLEAAGTGAAVTVGSTCELPRPVVGLVDLVR